MMTLPRMASDAVCSCCGKIPEMVFGAWFPHRPYNAPDSPCTECGQPINEEQNLSGVCVHCEKAEMRRWGL